LAAVGIGSHAWAQDYKLPQGAVNDTKVESHYGPPISVLQPLFPRENKVSIGLGGAYSSLSSLYNYYAGSASVTYYINRRHWIEPLYFAYAYTQTSSFVNEQIRDKSKSVGSNAALTVQQPKFMLAASYIFSPFYAKMHLGYRNVTHFDVFFGAGPAMIRSTNRSLTGSDRGSSTAFGGSALGGIRFLFGPRFGLRAEFRDFIYNSTNLGGKETINNFQLAAVIDVFFGSFNEKKN
jgi:hypothetical protein